MKNFIVILDGPMGAGKSTIAELIHKHLRRTALLGLDVIKWFISDFKRSKRDNAIVRKVVLQMSEAYLKEKINLVIPEGFTKSRASLRPYINLAKKYRAKLYVYHLDAPREVLLKRIKNRPIRKAVRTPITKSRILRNIRIWKKEKSSIGKVIDTSQATKEQIAKEILAEIKAAK